MRNDSAQMPNARDAALFSALAREPVPTNNSISKQGNRARSCNCLYLGGTNVTHDGTVIVTVTRV